MNAVGIDVSKGKSMVAVMRPFGEVVATPYEVSHTDADLRKLASLSVLTFGHVNSNSVHKVPPRDWI